MRMNKEQMAEVIGKPLSSFDGNCHGISLAVVKSGMFGADAQVARGVAQGVGSQHSWVSLGNPYSDSTMIVDPTLWTYRRDITDIWYGTRRDGIHTAHGSGHIMMAGRPAHGGGEDMPLDSSMLSVGAKDFLRMIEPLDYRGWAMLTHLPLEGWPSAEIIEALLDQYPKMEVMVPIDVIGNLLPHRNPSGLYR